jgi:hypothetical protein
MWEWFTKGVLRKNYIKLAKCGTIVKNPKHNLPKFEEYLALRYEMAYVLHEIKKDNQPLSLDVVQPILKCIIKSYVIKFIKPGHGGFNEILKIVKIIHETIHMLDL